MFVVSLKLSETAGSESWFWVGVLGWWFGFFSGRSVQWDLCTNWDINETHLNFLTVKLLTCLLPSVMSLKNGAQILPLGWFRVSKKKKKAGFLLLPLWEPYMLYLVVVKRCNARVWATTLCVLEDSPSRQTYRLEIWECICCCVPPAQTACLLIAETFVWCKMFNFIFIQPLQPNCDTVMHIVYYPRLVLPKSLKDLSPSEIPPKICSLFFR